MNFSGKKKEILKKKKYFLLWLYLSLVGIFACYLIFASLLSGKHKKITLNPKILFSYLINLQFTLAFSSGTHSLDISSDDKKVVISSGPNLGIMDLESGLLLHMFSSKDSKIIENAFYIDRNRKILIDHRDQTLSLFSSQSKKIEKEYKNPFEQDLVSNPVFTPKNNYKLFLSTNRGFWHRGHDSYRKKLKILDVDSIRPICPISDNQVLGFKAALSPNNHLAAWLDDIEDLNKIRSIKVINLSDCQESLNIPLAAPNSIERRQLHNKQYSNTKNSVFEYSMFRQYGKLSFSPNNKYLATNVYSQIWVYDITTGKLVKKFGDSELGDTYLLSLNFSTNGKFLAAGSDSGTIKIWEVSTEKLLKEFHSHDYTIDIIHFTNDDKRLISASNFEGFIRVWRTGL